MHPVLVLFAHPALDGSRVDRRLAEAVRGLEGVTFHDPYEPPPDHEFDAGRSPRLELGGDPPRR